MITESMSMGTKFANSIGLTLLGMGVVFIVLLVLSFSLDLLRVIAGGDHKIDPSPQGATAREGKVSSGEIAQQEDEELVAVIAAAIAAMRRTSVENIVVRTITPLPQRQNLWGATGRQQQMEERL